jgi:hypothetical protein
MAKQPAALARYWAKHRKEKTKTRSVSMAKRTHHKKQFTIPLAIVAGFVPAGMDIYNNLGNFNGNWLTSGAHTVAGLIGYDTVGKKYVGLSQAKAAGLYPILLGFAAHWAASRFGLNRVIARAGIPLIRI